MKKQTMFDLSSMPKLILAVVLIVCIGAVMGLMGWALTKKQTRVEAPKEIIEDETADWKTYSNPQNSFTFKYPKDWEIIEDYFYETAAGIKAKNPTIVLQKIGDNNSNNWIRINQRQFDCEHGKCAEVDYITIGTYSKNSEMLNVFDEIVESFKKIEKDETADWQIYRNEEYGFEVKYPEDWSVVTRGNYQVHFLDTENPGFDTYSEPGEGNIFITMDKLQNNQDLPSQYSSKSTVLINGNSAIRYEGIKGGHDQLNPSIIYTSVYLIKNDKKLKFNFSNRVSDKNDDKYITIFNKILSSFKFIEK